jgi:N6-adenosine-specific RNA methylase IME4
VQHIIIDPEFKASIPPLRPEEYAQLESNIVSDRRCRDPLCLWKGILVDGHNRYEICQKHGIGFDTVEIDCAGDSREHALAWMEEHQLGRRNISDDVRAVLAKRLMKRLSAFAMQEQRREAGKASGEARKAKSNESETSSDSLKKPNNNGRKKDTRAEVSKKQNISEWKLRTARGIDKKAKDDAKAIDNLVITGKITLNEAKKLAALSEEIRPETIKAVDGGADVRVAVRRAKKEGYNARIAATKPKPLEGTYRIIYADPCWKYHGLNQTDEYGHAEAHYDCLDDNQLMEFKPDDKRPIKELADDNSVLFMWVTAPLLERCFPIINAWGFKYKANFVWDKEDHVMGFYNSVRHEHLLIATRGSCTPDVIKLYDSVFKEKRAEHSKKPTEFYKIIETLYDHGRKLELFARSGRKGWDSVGNEVYLKEAAWHGDAQTLDVPLQEAA